MYSIYAANAAVKAKVAARESGATHRVSWAPVSRSKQERKVFPSEAEKTLSPVPTESEGEELPRTGTSTNTNPLLSLARQTEGASSARRGS